jgi:hypothetical protein
MFMCNQCLEQFEDSQLAYTLILEDRLSHPSAEMFQMQFCTKQHVQQFLERIRTQRQKYVLIKKGKGAEKRFESDYPRELLLLVGSSKAS